MFLRLQLANRRSGFFFEVILVPEIHSNPVSLDFLRGLVQGLKGRYTFVIEKVENYRPRDPAQRAYMRAQSSLMLELVLAGHRVIYVKPERVEPTAMGVITFDSHECRGVVVVAGAFHIINILKGITELVEKSLRAKIKEEVVKIIRFNQYCQGLP